VPANELKVKVPPAKSAYMWVALNQSGGDAPAAFLRDGKYLVPVTAPHGCEDLNRNFEFNN
jgi:hypothetical protein